MIKSIIREFHYRQPQDKRNIWTPVVYVYGINHIGLLRTIILTYKFGAAVSGFQTKPGGQSSMTSYTSKTTQKSE